MVYKYNGKSINIPDETLSKHMKLLGISKMEAVQMYLEDEGLLENDEQEALENKSKAQKIDHGAGKQTRQTSTRERKVNPEKRDLIAALMAHLAENPKVENLLVSKAEREISFSVGENTYALTLTCHRKK